MASRDRPVKAARCGNLVVRDPWFVTRGSWFVARGSWLVGAVPKGGPFVGIPQDADCGLRYPQDSRRAPHAGAPTMRFALSTGFARAPGYGRPYDLYANV